MLVFAAVMFWLSGSFGVDLTPRHLVLRRFRIRSVPWTDVVGMDLVHPPGGGLAIEVRTWKRVRRLAAPTTGWGKQDPAFRWKADGIWAFWVNVRGGVPPTELGSPVARPHRRPAEAAQAVISALLAAYAPRC